MHRLGMAPHLVVRNPGAPGHRGQEGALRRGRILQAHHHDPLGQGDLSFLQAGQEEGRQLCRRQPAALCQELAKDPGNPAPPGKQWGLIRGAGVRGAGVPARH